MSYIDTLPHRRVGTLAGYPLYHVLVNHGLGDPRGSADFSAGPKNFVLGGGSGEHPALVVHQLDQLVRLFLLQAIDVFTSGRPRTEEMAAFEDALAWNFEVRFDRIFEYCGWGIEQTATFLKAAQSGPGLETPYDADVHSSAEHWLAYSLAEACLTYCPDMAGPAITRILREYQEPFREVLAFRMNNVVYD